MRTLRTLSDPFGFGVSWLTRNSLAQAELRDQARAVFGARGALL